MSDPMGLGKDVYELLAHDPSREWDAVEVSRALDRSYDYARRALRSGVKAGLFRRRYASWCGAWFYRLRERDGG